MTADNVQAAGEQSVKLITLNKNCREALNTGAETLAEVLSLIERLTHIPTGGNDDDHI